MKIAMTSAYYPSHHIGGIEVHCRQLARGLNQKGHSVQIFTSEGEDGEIFVKGTYHIPLPYSPIPLDIPKDLDAHIYHSHIPSPFFARAFMRRDYSPHIITYHNDIIVPEKVEGKRIPSRVREKLEERYERLIRPVLDYSDAVIATTESYARTSPLLSDHMDKVEIVPNAVDADEFTPGKDAGKREPVVLFLGRLVERKGVHRLMRAMKPVQEETEARLVIVGGGGARDDLEELADDLSVNAEFKGELPLKKVRKWLRHARTLVLPARSRMESFGIVLLEAMASGTPVIGSDIPGVKEVAKEGGFTFSDERDLSNKIIRLLENDDLSTELGKKGRRAVEERYDWEVVLEDIEEVYSRVQGNR